MSIGDSRSGFVGWGCAVRIGSLLRVGPLEQTGYWSRPDAGFACVALGLAGEFSGDVEPRVHWLAEEDAYPPGPFIGGWAFDPSRPWPGFDAERWILPEILCWWDGKQSWAAAFGATGTPKEELKRRIDALTETTPLCAPPANAPDVGSRDAWERIARDAIAAVETLELAKVVPARVIRVSAPVAFAIPRVLRALESRNAGCTTFMVRGRGGEAFVGASPEHLCSAIGQNFVTEALAGTALSLHGEGLRSSEKDLREHQEVVDGILAALAPLSEALHSDAAPSEARFAHLIHLRTSIRAVLRPGVAPMAAARAIHPSPAVAGAPKNAAMDWLKRNEEFARGWYGGAVGLRGKDRLEVVVAIRCALLGGSNAHAFVGAGVVKGSTPQGEWEETNAKASTILSALGVASA